MEYRGLGEVCCKFLWKIRGYRDKLFGGVGLRRGRTNDTKLETGAALDFWRVLYANKSVGRLLLFAEMKLPGEAWLEFEFKENKLIQTATFRPHGILGRLYWYAVLPFHGIVFNGMIAEITKKSTQVPSVKYEKLLFSSFSNSINSDVWLVFLYFANISFFSIRLLAQFNDSPRLPTKMKPFFLKASLILRQWFSSLSTR
jgi:hypothetical protein